MVWCTADDPSTRAHFRRGLAVHRDGAVGDRSRGGAVVEAGPSGARARLGRAARSGHAARAGSARFDHRRGRQHPAASAGVVPVAGIRAGARPAPAGGPLRCGLRRELRSRSGPPRADRCRDTGRIAHDRTPRRADCRVQRDRPGPDGDERDAVPARARGLVHLSIHAVGRGSGSPARTVAAPGRLHRPAAAQWRRRAPFRTARDRLRAGAATQLRGVSPQRESCPAGAPGGKPGAGAGAGRGTGASWLGAPLAGRPARGEGPRGDAGAVSRRRRRRGADRGSHPFPGVDGRPDRGAPAGARTRTERDRKAAVSPHRVRRLPRPA